MTSRNRIPVLLHHLKHWCTSYWRWQVWAHRLDRGRRGVPLLPPAHNTELSELSGRPACNSACCLILAGCGWRSNAWAMAYDGCRVTPCFACIVCLHLLRKSRRNAVRPTVMAGTCQDRPGHDGGTTCRWHFHPIVVPVGGLGDCAKIHSWPEAPQGWQCGPRLYAIAAHPSLDQLHARSVKITLTKYSFRNVSQTVEPA
jgi:hypothetical protein